jgi:hypothetical protein
MTAYFDGRRSARLHLLADRYTDYTSPQQVPVLRKFLAGAERAARRGGLMKQAYHEGQDTLSPQLFPAMFPEHTKTKAKAKAKSKGNRRKEL